MTSESIEETDNKDRILGFEHTSVSDLARGMVRSQSFGVALTFAGLCWDRYGSSMSVLDFLMLGSAVRAFSRTSKISCGVRKLSEEEGLT